MAHNPGIVDFKLDGDTFTTTYVDDYWAAHYESINEQYGHKVIFRSVNEVDQPFVTYSLNIPS